jgi:CRISP-associated protein Cas1
MAEFPWVSVSGFGARIKSTQKHLIIQKKDSIEQYPLESVSNLLIVGGHTINSTTISQLAKNGTYITFFDPDGTAVGTIRPYHPADTEKTSDLPQTIPRQKYAIAIAQSSIRSRLYVTERIQELQNTRLFYEGELEVLRNSLNELEYLIKLDEIRRLHKLTSDMYYEIISRDLLPDLGFRRRTLRPQVDPVNAMLSFGYAMLYGNCYVAALGARLDPDLGLMHEGRGGLIYDLVEPLKATTVDTIVLRIAKESLTGSDYELTHDRCMLSDDLIREMMKSFYVTQISDKINQQVYNFSVSLKTGSDFKVLY